MHIPRVGIASLVMHDGRLLLGPRHKAPGEGSWQLPGGFMVAGEAVFDAATRLALEKAEVIIQPLQLGPYTNNVFPDIDFHSVTLYVLARLNTDQITKPLTGDWQWFDLDNLPQPLFLPLQLLLDDHDDWLHSVGVFE
ncbi:MAG: nucleotide triphosphate diphosphatase NUDT15 [Gammaproteobacteria bacterium]